MSVLKKFKEEGTSISKLFLGLFIGITISVACSMGKTSYTRYYERKETDKMWRACQDFETPNSSKSICNKTCLKRDRKGECKEWKRNIKTYETDGHRFLRDGNFVCVPEHYIYNL